MGRAKDNQRESVATKPMKSVKVPGPSKHDGRTGPRGTYESQTKPAWDGPSVILKGCDD